MTTVASTPREVGRRCAWRRRVHVKRLLGTALEVVVVIACAIWATRGWRTDASAYDAATYDASNGVETSSGWTLRGAFDWMGASPPMPPPPMPPSPSPPPPPPSSPPPSPSPPPPPPKPRFEEKSSTTPFAPDGGSVEYGNVHRVACANNSALVGFEFQSSVEGEETKVRNAYACVEALFDQGATFGHATLANETEHGPSGSKSLERNALDTLSEHEVDCADRFVTSWNLKQWSKSISIEYACASGKPTPKPDACVTSESAKVELDASKVSSLAPAKVSCTKGSALTRFRFTGGAFEFTCCPTPALE